ncbi:SigE family RNA polymerase sigma factor [Streptomyces sp. NPDC018833]|uniref:SigE family RNA polymerase sigma factor n=1 Tax=Streptomyces sp. NPDC018833 TaxID=3365053 RepID=UPI0037A22B66
MAGARGNNGGAPDFEEFVQARGPRLLRVAWLLTADAHLAGDLLQTALAKVWPKWRQIAAEHAEACVRKTIVNTHASWWHRRWRSEVPHGELPDRPAISDPFTGVDQEQALVTAVRQLPARQRAVLVLRYFEDLSVEETVGILCCRPIRAREAGACADVARRVHRSGTARSSADSSNGSSLGPTWS